MFFVFPPHIQAGLASGAYEVVRNNAGVALGIARDTTTGRFVGHAFEVVAEPFLTAPSLLLDGIQILQIHKGFQHTHQILNTLQASIGVLQATTAVIGVTSVAGVALSAVNLYQTLKLRQEVADLRVEVKEGFIETLERLREIPDQIEFRNHRTILVMAYGQFIEGLKLMRLAVMIADPANRKITLGNAQHFLANALNAYSRPELFQATCAAGKLRRFECVWAIEQAQAYNFQLLDEPQAASQCLANLQQKICQDSLNVIESCQSQEELDFIFPELTRIHTQDLPILKTWQGYLDWTLDLSPEEKQELSGLEKVPRESGNTQETQSTVIEPVEITEYEQLKSKSHFESLRDQLKFKVKPELRRSYEDSLRQSAIAFGQKALVPSEWEPLSDLTVANLYHYFRGRDRAYSQNEKDRPVRKVEII